MKALQTSVALGSAIGSKNPQMIMKAGLNSVKFLATGEAVFNLINEQNRSLYPPP